MAGRLSWQPVPVFAVAHPEATGAFDRLDDRLQAGNVPARRLERPASGRALLLSPEVLEGEACKATGLTLEGASRAVPSDEPVLLVAAETSPEALAALLDDLRDAGPDRPLWIGLEPAWLQEPAAAVALQDAGIDLDGQHGALCDSRAPATPALFQLYPLGPPAPSGPSPIPALGEKMGEGPGNLRGRGEWFGRRTGRRG
jgi:hypothetical protein